jgi:hypothetical protein
MGHFTDYYMGALRSRHLGGFREANGRRGLRRLGFREQTGHIQFLIFTNTTQKFVRRPLGGIHHTVPTHIPRDTNVSR